MAEMVAVALNNSYTLVLERFRELGHVPEWFNVVARADEAAERTRNRLAVPPPEICGKVFLRHWHSQATSAKVEMARRGFYGMEDLGRTVQRFFALDVQNARGSSGH
jgi:hypothetical protein